jgi:hypothetical protein
MGNYQISREEIAANKLPVTGHTTTSQGGAKW